MGLQPQRSHQLVDHGLTLAREPLTPQSQHFAVSACAPTHSVQALTELNPTGPSYLHPPSCWVILTLPLLMGHMAPMQHPFHLMPDMMVGPFRIQARLGA